MNRRISRAVAAAAVGAVVVSLGATTPVVAGPGNGHGNGHGKGQPGAVTGKAVHKHLVQLQKVADHNDGNRATGTSGYEESAQYVEKTLRKAGYHPERQYFDVDVFSVLDASVEIPGVALEPIVMSYSNSTADDGVSAELVAPSDPIGCDAAAWQGSDATGKIAVVSRGECSFGAKAIAAHEAGAAAVIIYNNTEGELNGTLGESTPESAPAVGVTQAEGAALVEAMEAGPVLGTFDVQTQVTSKETFNVIAETRSGDPENVVMAGAHLDSVEEGAGINDNGSGSAAILEAAVQMSKGDRGRKKGHGPFGKLNNKVRFAFWGAEELGLQGSTHYVTDLQANDPDAIEDIAVYLNFDMVGSPNYIIGVYDADESTYPAPVEVPEGSAAAEKAFTDYFDGNDQPWVDTEFSGRSDYQAFIEAGVPATGLFTGADGTKTEEEAELFGGTAGVIYDPNYHSVGDTIDNVDKDALDINSRAIGRILRDFSRSTEEINGVRPAA